VPLDIYMVRHGETQSNLDRVFQGHLDTSLTDRGLDQAHTVGKWLQDVPFDVVYSSDLARAADTARAISRYQHRSDVVLDRDLREMNYGVLQGVPISDFATVLEPYGVAAEWGSGAFSAKGLAPPGGESLRQLRNRVARFVGRLDADHPHDCDRRVLVVTHGGFLRVMMTVLLELPAKTRHAFAFENCSVTRFVRDSEVTRLEYHNFVCNDEAGRQLSVPGE
jgi:2,3-bisphosphoglycerate-dependent phosphoglycerate mutase